MKGNIPSKKKPPFAVSPNLFQYLEKHNSYHELPLSYQDLLRYNFNSPLLNAQGEDTLWHTVYFLENESDEIHKGLCEIYAILKMDGDVEALEHLAVDRIDFCTFGNTQPFRIRIINKLNDNYDHFYVKRLDASRVYGLELEKLISPNWVTYLVDKKTLIEEHVAGVPGDDFMKKHIKENHFDHTRIAKEFVKFNERCFVRLLGDMRAYNYIVDITPDIEGNQYRIRAIDFDQQSYEGWKNFYLPQYFKGNNPIIKLGMKVLTPATVKQYQLEERSLIALRAKNSGDQLTDLLKCMVKDQLSYTQKISRLKQELAQHHRDNSFENCNTMGELVFNNLKLVLRKEFRQSDFKLDLAK